MKTSKLFMVFILCLASLLCPSSGFSEDTPITRGTMANLQGLRIVVEHIQPNLVKYAEKAGLSDQRLQKELEEQLRIAGIRVVSGDQWLKTPGCPILYVNINTHVMDRFWYAYDIKLELRQIVRLVADPKVKTMADTWSINITGVANIGNFYIVKNDLMVLVERFVQAYRMVTGRI